jgi:transposase
LITRGERVVRVPTWLMANSRRSSRERGKSDRIDALAVARAAVAEGLETLRTDLSDLLCEVVVTDAVLAGKGQRCLTRK